MQRHKRVKWAGTGGVLGFVPPILCPDAQSVHRLKRVHVKRALARHLTRIRVDLTQLTTNENAA